MKTKALVDKLSKRLAEVTFETLDTSLSEMKAEALIDTLADKLTEVEMETLLNSGRRYAEALIKKFT